MPLFGLLAKRLTQFDCPGEATVSLPGKKVKINYEEDQGGRDGEHGWPGLPAGLEIAIRPATGGAALEIKRPLGTVTSGGRNRMGQRFGSIEITEPGDYVMTATVGSGREEYRPRIVILA